MNSVWPEWRRGAPKASKKVGLSLLVTVMLAISTAVWITVSGATGTSQYPPLICGDGNRPITCLTLVLLLLITRFVAGYPVAGQIMTICPGVALRYKENYPSYLDHKQRSVDLRKDRRK